MITIAKDFTAYPGGAKRAFRAGETVSDLTPEDAALYVAKGLAAVVDNGPERTENRRGKG